jgi:DNA-binding transcriptional LysR family regulator
VRKPDTTGTGREGDEAPHVSIEVRHLRYFLAVAEELHFGRAAERLHIAQPPLSQAIRRLESSLGVRLFERTSRHVSATAAGLAFAVEARKVLASLDRAVAEARRVGGATDVLRIGCIPHLPIARLLQFVAALREYEPSSAPLVTHLLAREQMQRLRAGELDLGIFHDAGDHEGLDVEPVFPGEPLAAFLPPDHRLAEKEPLTPADVADEALVTWPSAGNPALHRRLLERLEAAGYRLRPVREAAGADARDVILGVAAGPGIAVMPFSLREVADSGGIVVRRTLDPPVSMPDTVVAWQADAPRQPTEVLDNVRRIARELRETGEGKPDSL